MGKKPEGGAEGDARGITYTSRSVDHDVELCITYMEREHKDAALKKIREFCQEQEKTVIIGGGDEKDTADLIKKLDGYKEYELKDVARKHGVTVEIDKQRGSIRVKGHEKDVNGVVLSIHQALYDQGREMQEEGEAEMIAQFVQWQFEHNGKFEPYPQDINMDIEKAHREEKPSVSWVEERGDKKKKFTVYFKYDVEEDESKKRTKIRRYDLKGTSIENPKEWDQMGQNDRYTMVLLQASSPEYQKVEKAFRQTVPSMKIVKIERIQNPSLYRRYAVHKQQMEKPNEKELWHGTSPQVVPNIVANGFNRSYCGLHGIKYGHGVYFAPKAQYPVSFHQGNYCQPDASGNSFLFFNQVLVGDYTWGQKDYREPPPKNPSNPTIRYDSCVNNMKNIDEFVIFTDTQCYPAYLMTYKIR